MCSIIGCNQASYFESEVGHCYYHHKVELGLIVPDEKPALSEGEHKNVVFAELQPLVSQAMKKINLIDTSSYEDLKQHLYLHLWTLIPTIRKDAREKEVFSYVRLALKQEGVRFANRENDYVTSADSLDLVVESEGDIPYNPENIFIENILKQKQREVIVQFTYEELNDLESMLFNDLFMTDDTITLRDLALKYNKSHVWVHKYGLRLYERFKGHAKSMGYQASELI